MSEFITIARVVKTQGRRGEVAAELHTDFPERFAERRRLFALDERGDRRELQLEEFWPHQGRMVLKFAGVDTISDAETLIGSEIQIPLNERAELEPGASYISDLVGCVVTVAGEEGPHELGRIEDVQFGAGEAPLLTVRAGKKEYFLPFAAAYLKSVDTQARRIEMALPEGMLDLDAPLSAEEKREQQKGS